ncbi:hypothetical protein [Actinoplanes rectilineatus]|uniref:hypothetical protein n=1 Tax=Actinoplanes rectilineatus TaxID=113571 RepID=UPI0005F29D90|nr:hypothetical protein [Actinoplanes rectilineatus]
MTVLDRLVVGAELHITEPASFADRDLTDWRTLAWLPARPLWPAMTAERGGICIGLAGGGHAWLDLTAPHDRIHIREPR